MVWVFFACFALHPESCDASGRIESISAATGDVCHDIDFSFSEECEILEESDESEEHLCQKTLLPRIVEEYLSLIHNINTHCKLSRLNQSIIKHNISPILQICQRTVLLQV